MSKSQTIIFKNQPVIIGSYSIVGPKEGKGNFGPYFNYVLKDDSYGEKSYEKAEKKMIESAIIGAIEDAKIKPNQVEMLLAGDLLNQIISSSYAARNFDTVFLGLFGACSTMAESLAVGATLVNGKHFDNVVCATGSHFSTAERQFRFPLELGNQRPPSSQWTVTGAGATVLASQGKGPRITMATFGKVIDFGVNDVNDMGAVMAPAAMDTMLSHFRDAKRTPDDYDLIVTGDLGKFGSEILIDLMETHGIKLGLNYNDCGQMYFTRNQNTLSGGSGCGCSATVLNSFIINKLRTGELQRVLYMPTGALMSTTASQQGETIPAVCHALVIESDVKPVKDKEKVEGLPAVKPTRKFENGNKGGKTPSRTPSQSNETQKNKRSSNETNNKANREANDNANKELNKLSNKKADKKPNKSISQGETSKKSKESDKKSKQKGSANKKSEKTE